MRIGHRCIDRTLDGPGNKTFLLRSYSEERLLETVANNLDVLSQVLAYNVRHGILFFRITSDLVPFASHPVMKAGRRKHFRSTFRGLGQFVRENEIRTSMHRTRSCWSTRRDATSMHEVSRNCSTTPRRWTARTSRAS
jgi:UV DNA damage endonuclease